MGHTCKNGSHLQKWVTLVKNGSLSEKRVALVKIRLISKHGSHLKKLVHAHEKIDQTLNNGSHFEKQITVEKSHTGKNRSLLEQWVALGKKVTLKKIGHTEKRVGPEKWVKLGKWVTIEKMGNTCKMGHI